MTMDRFKARFDGVKAFAALPPDVQTAIGGAAVEMIIAGFAAAHFLTRSEKRPYEVACAGAMDKVHKLVLDAVPGVIAAEHFPVPSLLGQVCRCCGCSEDDACLTDGRPCHWVEADLCSACVGTPS